MCVLRMEWSSPKKSHALQKEANKWTNALQRDGGGKCKTDAREKETDVEGEREK